MKRNKIQRRQVLKGILGGAAIAVALPRFDFLLNDSGTAFADGTAFPTRFGIWFWGNGIRPESWAPSTEGQGWVASKQLAPLDVVRPYVSVVTNCKAMTGTTPDAHYAGVTAVLSGTTPLQVKNYIAADGRSIDIKTLSMASIDQRVAKIIGGDTRIPSLEVRVTKHVVGADFAGTLYPFLSHNGPNDVNPPTTSPQELFNKLFVIGSSRGAKIDHARNSVLDSVHEQLQTLQRSSKLSSNDRQRLLQHSESVRALEKRLAATPLACTSPKAPGTLSRVGGGEPISENNLLNSQLVAFALSCDITRVFTLQFSGAVSQPVFLDSGLTAQHHEITHNTHNPNDPTAYIRDGETATAYIMSQFATFLKILRDTTEGDGNLLDRCSIYAGSELGNPKAHTLEDVPVIIAGKGNGRLKGGEHRRFANYENVSRAVLTAIRGAGVDMKSFGEGAAYTDQSIGALEA